MPLNGTNHTVNVFDDSPYFKSLSDLDAWAKSPSNKLKGVMSYHSREVVQGVQAHNRGKLLVCHDYKGGYTESPSALSYTFNFWPYCDTFIYFSHHRITVPPSGWTNAAHRNGVRMLGTLIFESSGEEDCLRLLVGALPKSKTGPAIPHGDTSLPLSPHYAYLLAELAYQRGFDGYLLNFECPLRGRLEQTRILAAWLSLLEIELKRRVGSHAEAIWYDSVVLTGDLRWQDRLNHYNLPFFIPSSGFFTNYTWPPHYPSLTAQYFISLDPTHLSRPKSLHNIFVGIDVWGRGSHGGGGFGCYKAISHIDPQFLGLSVALFGQAWTWESEQDKPGWTWDAWWTYERKLWLGPTNESEPITLPPPREGEPECPHGPFLPISSFFVRQPPPNPAALPFFTSFSPGVGRLWFVRGIKVMRTDDGWTDVDKNCSLGDLAWPRVALQWEHGEREDALPELSSELCMTDAWLGGSSLQLILSTPGSDAEDAFFRCVWVPIQTLAITPRKTYEMSVIYKDGASGSADLDIGLSVKVLADGISHTFEVMPVSVDGVGALPGGWTKLAIQFVLPIDHAVDILAAAGLVVGFACEDPTQPLEFSILLGSISVYPSPSPQLAVHEPKILWADFESDRSGHQDDPTYNFSGVLTWSVAGSFSSSVANIRISSPEDPQPVWLLDPSFPSFLYFNIYVQSLVPNGSIPEPEHAVFIGTTGLDGRANRFFVDPACIPHRLLGASFARFYVQGVTDKGDVLGWEHCAFVDVKTPLTTDS